MIEKAATDASIQMAHRHLRGRNLASAARLIESSRSSRFWNSKGADHGRATGGVEESEWMKHGGAESQNAEPQVVLYGLLTEGNSEQEHDGYARRDRSAFKVLDFTCGIRQRICRYIEPRKAADAAYNKVGKDQHVPAAAHSQSEAENRWCNSKRNNIRQRIQVCPQQGPSAGTARPITIDDVTDKRNEVKYKCDPEESVPTFRDVIETEKNGDRAAARIPQGEQVCDGV